MYETLQAIGWAGNVVCLIGAYHIAHQKRVGYVLIAAACLMILPSCIFAQLWNQVGLELVYLPITVKGWIHWGKAK